MQAQIDATLTTIEQRIAGKRVALAFSGGKDSQACLELLRPHLDRVTVYWLNTGSVWKSFTSIGQIKKFYSKKKALYKKYTDEQKVNFEDQASVAHLIHYMETN